jgi:hypothetical protein
MVASMKVAIFWIVALFSLVAVCRHVRGTSCLHHQIALMMWAASTSEMTVNLYQTTWHSNPEDGHLQCIKMFIFY